MLALGIHHTLTQDGLVKCFSPGIASGQAYQPTLQVLSLKKVRSAKNEEHAYRLIISDGNQFVEGYLASSLQIYVDSEDLQPNSVIKVLDYAIDEEGNRRVLIVLDIEIIGTPSQRFGQPRDYFKSGANMIQARPASGSPGLTTKSNIVRPTKLPKPANPTNPYISGLKAPGECIHSPYGSGTTKRTTADTLLLSLEARPASGAPGSTGTSNIVTPTKLSKPANVLLHKHTPMKSVHGSKTPVHASPINLVNEEEITSCTNPYISGLKAPVKSIHNPYGSGTKKKRNKEKVSPMDTLLLSQLSTSLSHFTIRVRVLSKSDIQKWSNSNGQGCFCNVVLLDESGMDIRATMFNNQVDLFHGIFEVGKVYSVTGGKIKLANTQYNTCKSQYEITFNNNTKVTLLEDTQDIPVNNFEFTKLSQIEKTTKGSVVDVVGVIHTMNDLQTFNNKKSGQEMQKMDVILIDDTGVQIQVTMWGSQALNASMLLECSKVVAFQRVRVSDYGGLSLNGPETYFFEPDIAEKEMLHEWWKSQGAQPPPMEPMDATTTRKQICDITLLKERNCEGQKVQYITFRAYFVYFRKNENKQPWYTACCNQDSPCYNRYKVTRTTDGEWLCNQCQQKNKSCIRKWMFPAVVCDDTNKMWVSLFDKQALTLLEGKTAEEAFKEHVEKNNLNELFAKVYYTDWIFQCQTRNYILNSESKQKITILKMEPPNYLAESVFLIAEIEKLK